MKCRDCKTKLREMCYLIGGRALCANCAKNITNNIEDYRFYLTLDELEGGNYY
jgi:hypothetical protein